MFSQKKIIIKAYDYFIAIEKIHKLIKYLHYFPYYGNIKL